MIEGKVEGMERPGRRCKQPLNNLKETRRYWKLKEVALDPTVWKTRLGRSCRKTMLQPGLSTQNLFFVNNDFIKGFI
jgi:hypothetical protein